MKEQTNNFIIRDIDFLGDRLRVIQNNITKTMYVGIKSVCKGLGLNKSQFENQIRKIKNDLLLKDEICLLNVATNGGTQAVSFLKLDFVPIWLAKIHITPSMKKEKKALVKKLVYYQLNAVQALSKKFDVNQLHTIQLENNTNKIDIESGQLLFFKDLNMAQSIAKGNELFERIFDDYTIGDVPAIGEIKFIESILLNFYYNYNLYTLYQEQFNDVYRLYSFLGYNSVLNVLQSDFLFLSLFAPKWNPFFINNFDSKFSQGKFTAELNFEQLLMNYFKSKKFDNVYHQINTPEGRTDIVIMDKNKQGILELKKGEAERKNIYQVFDYNYEVVNNEKILIAKNFSPDITKLASNLKVFCYSYKIIKGLSVYIKLHKCNMLKCKNVFDSLLPKDKSIPLIPLLNIDNEIEKEYMNQQEAILYLKNKLKRFHVDNDIIEKFITGIFGRLYKKTL